MKNTLIRGFTAPRILIGSTLALVLLLSGAPKAHAQAEPTPLGLTSSRTAPYRYAGRLVFDSGNTTYLGSGTAVTNRGVLTAAHNLYDPDYGFSTDLVFERGRYGSSVLSRSKPRTLVVLSGYTSYADSYGPDSSLAFSRDLGGLRFSRSVAGGSHAAYITGTASIKTSTLKIGVGYGAEWHSGSHMLAVRTTARSTAIRNGYYDNNGFILEGGMSGGPLFIQTSAGLRVGAVLVSGSNYDAGIRAIDSTAASFIRTNL